MFIFLVAYNYYLYLNIIILLFTPMVRLHWYIIVQDWVSNTTNKTTDKDKKENITYIYFPLMTSRYQPWLNTDPIKDFN